MPATRKAPAKPARSQSSKVAHDRAARADRAVDRVAKSLEAAQKDLAAIGDSLGTGANELRKDVAKLLRDASRDVAKMSKAVRQDLTRLQKDLGVTPRVTARRARPASSGAKSTAAKRAPRRAA